MDKICKQCGRKLPVDSFRKYTPRGNGTYKTTQGCYTICKDCETISARAAAALRKGDQAVIDKLRAHYETLRNRGLEPVTKPAKQLLGVDTQESKYAALDDLLTAVGAIDPVYSDDLMKHVNMVRTRGYESAEAADYMHRTHYASQLKLIDEELYAEITELVDAWYLEG